jgi:hypothetical protein
MLIAKVTDTGIDVADHVSMLPNTSFGAGGPTLAQIGEMGYLQVTLWKPYDHATEKLVSCPAYVEDNQVFTIQVEPKTQEELNADLENKAMEVRLQRNALLAQSDWTQVKDVPNTISQVWAAYRKELRNLPEQAKFPKVVTWPTDPDAVILFDSISGSTM